MSRNQSPVQEVHDDPDGYEFQIALDQLSAGSTEALRLYLARKNGQDPATVSLRTTPWKPSTSEGTKLYFAGKLDDTRAPVDKDGAVVDEAREMPRVIFEDTEKPFDYKALDAESRQFRLLRLAPPDEHGVTRQFQLETFSLNDAPPYFCLSYVWGDPERFLGVNCNGEMISVTQNLYHALRTCFNRHPDSWLWADGICVNQEDVVERSQQVLLMGDIYRNASMVLAHPGHFSYVRKQPEEEDVKRTVLADRLGSLGMQDMLSFGAETPAEEKTRVGEEKPYGIAEFALEPLDDAYDPGNIQGAISIMTYMTRVWSDTRRDKILSDLQWNEMNLPDPGTESGREIWDNLVRFWTTDWYFRTWVLQEVILGAKVVVLYGTTAISLEAITEFWDLARRRGLPRPLRIGAYADIFNMVLHLSPVASFKILRDRREGLDNSPENVEDDVQPLGGRQNQNDVGILTPINGNKNSKASENAAVHSSSLLELLCLTRNNLATDPRDKIYGLLGLTDDMVARSTVPDYSHDNTPAKVFIEVATHMVELGHAADLLHHAGIDQAVRGLPSWAPDWTMQSRSTLPVHLYNCLPDTSPTVSILSSDEKPNLRVRGAVLARINTPGPAWRYYSHDPSSPPFSSFKNARETEIPPFNDEDARNFILAFLSYAAEGSLEERYRPEALNDALVRTLAVDCSWQNERIGIRRPPQDVEKTQAIETAAGVSEAPTTSASASASASASDAFFAGVDAFRRFYARGPDSEEDLKEPGIRLHQTHIFQWLLDFDQKVEADLQQRMVPFTVPFQEAQRGRRWAAIGTRGPKTTEDLAQDAAKKAENPSKHSYDTKALTDCFMGTVPWDAETEDYVVLLEGFRTPFVLRKSPEETTSDGKSVFNLIGDCYVHDAMDGQLMAWVDEMEEELQRCQVGKDARGRAYVIRTPGGFASFEDFIIT
ncbi:Heterokaryon incompatibility protein 6, OR allele [Colletotrichum higginsianum]|uniref:Heterokaryon incompatibility protein 6, OR allele n=1 Tax=Colletotrichum higginsianum TaxID=80884 RepID=A0A4V4NAW7_9PEZI|nr:Heterokaryon incompatibility protein 6, OR allele [Colletotrichum higginsianum]